MAKLKAFVKSLEEIDEGLHPLYTQDEEAGGFVLDIDEKEYKAKLAEFRNGFADANKSRRALEEQIKQFEGIDPAKYAAAQKAMEQLDKMEEGQLLKEGKLDEVLKKRTAAMQADHEGQLRAKEEIIKKAQDEIKAKSDRLGALVIDTSVQSAATKAGTVRSGAMDDILSRARRTFLIDENGNMVPRAPNGEALYGKDGEPLRVEEWASNLVTTAPHLFEPSRGGGASGGARGDGGKTPGIIDRSDPVAFGKNLEAIAAGKVLAK